MVALWVTVPQMGQAQGANTAPTAADHGAATAENTAVNINVVANNTAADGDTLSVTSVTTPSNGTAAIESGNTTSVTYTPDTDFNGADSFDYTLSDGADTDTGTVTVSGGCRGDGQAALTWDDPSNSSITGHEYLQALVSKLTASDGAANYHFGFSLAVDGDTMVVGAHGDDDNGSASGAAYVLTRQSGTWSQVARLTAFDGEADDQFGYALSVDGDTLVVGAPYDDENGSESGSAYVYSVSDWTAVPDSAAGETNATFYTVTGLTNDAEYAFWIRATNGFGTGPASAIVTVTPAP